MLPKRALAVSLFLAIGSMAESKGPFDGLKFREIGPASPAGRIDDFAVLESNPAVFYVATATGGLWKTLNHGTTFEVLFDEETTSSLGDVAIAPNDPNLVWVGTGENNNRQSSSWGDGVYKSADGGKTWRRMGLENSRHIARILIDPGDLDTVYVAALGSLWGSGGERGVYKTMDGGITWSRILHVDDDTGATELVMDPRNPKVIYAATYQRRRATWGFNGGGPGSAIHKTTDGGRNWTKLTEGIPEGPMGRIGLDVYRKNPNVVYARIEHPDEGGVYRSDDAGASWAKLSPVNPRPMYFSQIRVDPNDDSRIYVLGVQLHVSDDGGRTFRDDGAEKIHVDFHAMWIDPANSNHVLLGGDGGVGISHDRSATYVWLNNMNLGQFYHVSYDTSSPYVVCGGLQDNNTWCGPSAVRSRGGIANDAWFIIGGGDGFVALVDPKDPRILYSESQNGRMNRVDRVTNERQSIRPEPPAGEPKLRWNWDTPMMLSPHDPATIFVAANKVFRSGNRGSLWEAVSPDLTSNADREELELM
ncbi:MAG: WD40/YVTN/BNR-like repeat-containing protein, partial [Vicinamibacteria bacterium]